MHITPIGVEIANNLGFFFGGDGEGGISQHTRKDKFIDLTIEAVLKLEKIQIERCDTSHNFVCFEYGKNELEGTCTWEIFWMGRN